MKLNHFSSKRKGWGDRLAGRLARDERILKAGWQPHFSVPGGGLVRRRQPCRAPALQTVAVTVAWRRQGSHLGPGHLPPECREWQWEAASVYAGRFRELNLKGSHLGRN